MKDVNIFTDIYILFYDTMYNWNIVDSGIKHPHPKHILFLLY
jgi:hypothetical protein